MTSWCDKCKLPRFETNNELGKRLGQLLVKMEMNLQQTDHDDLLRADMADAHDISRRLLGKTEVCQAGSGICTGATVPAAAVEPLDPPIVDIPAPDSESDIDEIQAGAHQLRITIPSRVLVPRLQFSPPGGMGRGCEAYPDLSSAAVPVVGD